VYAKSDAWKRALPGFVPALERLPGVGVTVGAAHDSAYWQPDEAFLLGHDDDDRGQDPLEDDARECAACRRLHSRATVELVFRGLPGDPPYLFGTKCAALRWRGPPACL
jgi:hypothetical protein